jgi:peptidoglycan/xylan/chitin deacetylase (PgdA/CDA1 family)
LGTEKRSELYEKLLPVLRRMNSSGRDKKITELAEVFNSPNNRPSHRAMTFDELLQMSLSPSAVIGAHTHLHPSLGALNYEEQFAEIETSKRLLENLLNKKVTHFSYPFGTVLDFNNDTLEIVKKLNFELVAANIPYPANRKTNKYFFPRFLVRNWNKTEFEAQLKSFGK